MSKSISDHKNTFLDGTDSVTDQEMRWAGGSGSLADRRRIKYGGVGSVADRQLPFFGAGPGSIADREKLYWENVSVGGTVLLPATLNSGSVFGQSETYNTARNTGTGSSGSNLDVGQYNYPSDTYTPAGYLIYETFLEFDTSGIVGTITSATLKLGLTVNPPQKFIIEARLHDYGSVKEIADYVSGDTLGSKLLLATLDTAVADGVFPYTYDLMIENGSNLRTSINRTGFTRILLNADRHRLSNVPISQEYASLDSYLGTNGVPPRLEVVTV